MSSLVQAYERLLLGNVETVRSVESGLRNLTWLLPGRFEDSEIASEGLFALLSVVSSYHDTLLGRRITKSLSLPPHPFAGRPAPSTSETSTAADATSTASAHARVSPLVPPPSDHARYTRYWTDRSRIYKRASRTLSTLTYLELLMEMIARRKGNDRIRWRVVLVIEAIKTCLRLVIIGITRRPVLNPPVPKREFDITSLPDIVGEVSGLSANLSAGSSSKAAVESIAPGAPLRSHLYPMAGSLPDSHLPHPLSLLPELSASAFASELLTSTATLAHLLLLLRAQRLPTNALRATLPSLSTHVSPFLVPLAFRLVARHIRPPPGDSLLLASHYAGLDRRMASSFFLQGPMWVGWTRPKIMAVLGALERIPLIGLAGGFVEGYIPLVDDYFYYTTA